MAARTPYSEAIVDGLLDWGLDIFVHVPSSHVEPIIASLEEHGIPGILANREDEAAGIVAGLVLAGRRAALVIQDNGFGNALTILTTLVKAYHIGVPIIANARGGLGEYNSMIHSFSAAVPQLLDAADLAPQYLGPQLPPAAWRKVTTAAAELATTTHRPITILAEMMHPMVEESA